MRIEKSPAEHDVLAVDESTRTFTSFSLQELLNLRIGTLFGVKDVVAPATWVGIRPGFQIRKGFDQIRDVDSCLSKSFLASLTFEEA
ncbi:MAG TPA: hypothetical protein VK208_08355 [Pyrinomonadaceae bacterium]|nr:hypothetical protein [Pyrinomonadaceae bacterium]